MLSKFLKFIAAIIFLFVAVFFSKDYIFKKDYNTFTVEKSDIVNSVSANGFVVSNLISDLYFDASGKIKKINFQTGDKVKINDILAELEAKKENKNLSEAKLLLEKADDNLTTENPLTAKEIKEFNIKLIKLEIELKKNQLDNLKGLSEKNEKIAKLKIKNLQNILADSDTNLLKAEKKIEDAENTGEKEITKNKQLLIKTIEEILSISSSTLSKADNILGIDNKEANDQFEKYLGVLKRGVFKNAKLAYKKVKDDYLIVDNNFNNFNNSLNKEKKSDLDIEKTKEKEKKINIIQIAELTKTLLLSIDNLLFKTRILLNNTKTYEIAPNKKKPTDDAKKIFTKNELNELKLMIDNRKSQNSSKIDLLKNKKELLLLAEKNLLIAKEKFQNEYDKINLNNQEIAKNLKELQENSIKIKKNEKASIKSAESILNEQQKNLTAIESDKIKIATDDFKKLLNKTKKLLSLANKNLDDTKLKALNNCIITDIKTKIGKNISQSQIFAIAISTQVIAESNISKSDIEKIKIGQKTIFNFANNLKSEEEKIGKIIEVDLNNEKIKYALDEYGSHTIKHGMPIDLTIIIAKKENSLSIPLNAIIRKGDETTVKILQNKKIRDKKIEAGVIGNNNMVEIISGLKEGEEVIIL